MRSHLESAEEKLRKYHTPIIDVTATISQESPNYRVDLVANVRRGALKSSGEAGSVRVAVNHAADRMGRQLK